MFSLVFPMWQVFSRRLHIFLFQVSLGRTEPEPPGNDSKGEPREGIPKEMLLGGQRADCQCGPKNPDRGDSQVASVSFPPVANAKRGKKGLGNVQAGPRVEGFVQPVEARVKRCQPPF